jgi:hypothetical protein
LELEEVIFSLEKTSHAAISDSAVRCLTRGLGGKIFVIALNSSNDRGADIELTLPNEFRYAAKAGLKFENRHVDVENGEISDTFKPLERHIHVADILN